MSDSQSNAISNDSIAEWVRKIAPAKRKVQEANGVYRALLKKADSDGMNTKALIRAMNNKKKEVEEIATDLRDELRYMAVMRMPIAASDIYNGWDDRVTEKTTHADMVWDANDKGYKAGRAGATVESCEYPGGSELHVAWVKAWHDGQAANVAELGEDTTVVSAARERPSRKQGHLAEAQQEQSPAPEGAGAANGSEAISAEGVEAEVRKAARKAGRKGPPAAATPGRKAGRVSGRRTAANLH